MRVESSAVNRRDDEMQATKAIALVMCLALISPVFAGEQAEPPKAGIEEKKVVDFSDLDPKKWVINEKTTRFVESKDKDGKKVRTLRIAKARFQLAYVRDFVFKNGTLECDMRGGAYLGIAFRVRDGGKGELVYFRPPGVEGDDHTIQYVAMKMKTFGKWEWLRKNYPGKYETGVVPIPGNKPGRHWWRHPNPFSDEWFHVKLVVSDKEVKAFVGDNKKPSLVVSDLKYGEEPGSVGLYAWRGEFKNFKVQVDK
jgi:hypothetical protein